MVQNYCIGKWSLLIKVHGDLCLLRLVSWLIQFTDRSNYSAQFQRLPQLHTIPEGTIVFVQYSDDIVPCFRHLIWDLDIYRLVQVYCGVYTHISDDDYLLEGHIIYLV